MIVLYNAEPIKMIKMLYLYFFKNIYIFIEMLFTERKSTPFGNTLIRHYATPSRVRRSAVV